MDQKGLIATADALLALVIVFIVLGTIPLQINNSKNLAAEPQKNTAQDIMELMVNYELQPGGGSVLEQMANILENEHLSENSKQKAGLIASQFFNQIYPGLNYKLTEINQLNGNTLSANGNIEEADNINSAQRNIKGYCFQLYVWY